METPTAKLQNAPTWAVKLAVPVVAPWSYMHSCKSLDDLKLYLYRALLVNQYFEPT